jgi:hypothetical protein
MVIRATLQVWRVSMVRDIYAIKHYCLFDSIKEGGKMYEEEQRRVDEK